MAHLNLRERVIETTIAYLGAEESAGAVNFAHVGRDQGTGRAGALKEAVLGGGRLLSLDWRPRGGAKLNDCELRVKLVSMDGAVEPDAVQQVLVDADGLVLVLETGDQAAADNDRAVATVREALSRAPERNVPVVVQVNRREGDEEASALGGVVEEWPRVSACAEKGDGVMETLQRAFEGVVESMHRQPAGEDAAARAPGAPRVEGNPLLGALRQILQATVSEQIAALEARLVERLDRQPSVAGQAATKSADEEAAARAAASRRDALLDDLQGLASARLDRVEAAIAAASERVAAAQARAPSREDLTKLQALVAAEAKARFEQLATEAREHGAVVHEKTSRAVLDGAVQMKVALDALTAALKQESARAAGKDLEGAIGRLGARTEGVLQILESLVTEIRAQAPRVDALAPLVQRATADSEARHAEVRDLLQVANERVDKQADALQGEIAALNQELRARKKSWF